MSEEQLKSYYAIIPANVRYDPDLTPNAKLLYGEITALTNEKGYCWATNKYFANLYKCTPQAISKWTKILEKKNYITIKYVYKDNSKEIDQRIICLVDKVSTNVNRVSTNVSEASTNNEEGYQQKVKENNTSSNNTFNNTYYSNKELNDLFIDFLKMRKQLRAVNSERAINSLIKTLSQYDDAIKYKMIENSITNSWKGVFPIKENKGYQQKPVREEEVPKWIKQDTKKEEMTADEQAEMEELLKDFKEPKKEYKPNPELQKRLKEKYKPKGG